MALVNSVWESDGGGYELCFVTVCVPDTGHEKKTVGTCEDSWHCVVPADKCEKCSNIVIKGKKSLIVQFYQLMVSFFTAEIRVLKYIIVYLISVCCLY